MKRIIGYIIRSFMKTRIPKTTLATFATIGLLALVIAGCASPTGKSRVRVTEENQYIRLTHLQDTSQALDAKKHDAPAMACGKCQTVWHQSLNSPSSQFVYPPTLRGGIAGSIGWQRQQWAFHDSSQWHYCPGCKSTITSTGAGKDRQETIKHTCNISSSDPVFCCATGKDAMPTGGMAKK